MRYFKVIALCGALFFWGLPLQAAELTGLYETEVVVVDQGREARATAMTEAMAAVLIKVSGSSSVVGEEVMKSAMANAARYVQQYRYRSNAEVVGKNAQGDNATTENELLLWVGFDSVSIDKLLRNFGFTVWSAARPTTLVWLVVEDGLNRVLVGANDKGLVHEVLNSEAQRRATPLLLPLLDLADQSKVHPGDVWGGFLENIELASKRYETQAVLTGKLYSVGGEWEASWTLSYQGLQHQWQQRDSDVTTVIVSGVGGISDYLSQRFAENNGAGVDQLALRVEAVNGMGDFRRINDYLLSLHGVTTVTLRQVEASASSFLLNLDGNSDAVLQAISMGDVLVKVDRPVIESMPPSKYDVEPPIDSPAEVLPESGQVLPVSVTEPQSGDSEPEVENVAPETDAELLPQQPEVIPLQELVYRLLS